MPLQAKAFEPRQTLYISSDSPVKTKQKKKHRVNESCENVVSRAALPILIPAISQNIIISHLLIQHLANYSFILLSNCCPTS